MKVSSVMVLLAAAVLLVACEPQNGGGGNPGQLRVDSFTITPDSALTAGDDVTLTVTFTANGPVDLAFDLGGGATPNSLLLDDVTSPLSQDFLLSELGGGTFTATATLTDGLGQTATASQSYTYGTGVTEPPVIVSIDTSTPGVLAVEVSDPDGDDVTVDISAVTGGSVDPASRVVADGDGTATFSLTAADLFGGGIVSGTITVRDFGVTGESDTFSATVPAIGPIAVNRLFAIPLQSTAAVGEPVRIVVATGPTSSPFQFVNAVRVTGPAGFEYVPDSFDIGTYDPGNNFDDVDGIWSMVSPSSFLTAPDNFIVTTPNIPGVDNSGLTGRTAIDFNVTPLGGSDVLSAQGAIFSFEALFAAGENVISFQELGGVDRTYYTDSNASPKRYWNEATNNYPGVPNTVTVN